MERIILDFDLILGVIDLRVLEVIFGMVAIDAVEYFHAQELSPGLKLFDDSFWHAF